MKKIVFLIIIIIASILRVWNLSDFPAGLNADEAALGYNAYSLLETGKDEHGHSWPVNLESFGDFKPAGYTYILLPFIKVLGLNAFAVRLPSALFGILGVVFIYLLVSELTTNGHALVSAALLAVSPWHLHFSRGGWEVNVATTLLMIGLWSIIKWLKNSNFKYLCFCVLVFGLSMYVYQSTRIIAPVLGLGLVFLYWHKFWQSKRQAILAFGMGLTLLLPLGWSIIKSDAGSRLSGVGLLADLGPVNRVNELRGHYGLANPPIYVKFLYNRVTAYGIQFMNNYLSHFDGNFLFVNGDLIERNKIPETGLLYLTDFIFLAIGIYYLLRSKIQDPRSKILWLWLFVAPLAAAMTFQVPHALRSQNMVIPLTILAALGVYWVLKRWKWLGLLIGVIYSLQIARYLHEYYVHYPQKYPAAWEYGFSELVSYVESVKGKYSQIIITDKYDQPYILFLFYQKYPPHLFQNNHQLTFRDKYNFSTVRDYDKYHFGLKKPSERSLIVATPEEAIGQTAIIKTINFPNDRPAFKIYEKN